MLTFYLIRHGTKETIPFDPPLTALGIRQAEITAAFLRNIPFSIVLSSPKLRTLKTAEILAKPHGLPVITDDRLVERLEWENGQSFQDFMDEWKKTDINRNYHPKTGISSHKNGERMEQVLTELIHSSESGNILIVTHGGTIGDTLRRLFTDKQFTYVTDPETGATYINILECSITKIRYLGSSFNLLTLGDVSHLSLPVI